jgi:hypothetical protein
VKAKLGRPRHEPPFLWTATLPKSSMTSTCRWRRSTRCWPECESIWPCARSAHLPVPPRPAAKGAENL